VLRWVLLVLRPESHSPMAAGSWADKYQQKYHRTFLLLSAGYSSMPSYCGAGLTNSNHLLILNTVLTRFNMPIFCANQAFFPMRQGRPWASWGHLLI